MFLFIAIACCSAVSFARLLEPSVIRYVVDNDELSDNAFSIPTRLSVVSGQEDKSKVFPLTRILSIARLVRDEQ